MVEINLTIVIQVVQFLILVFILNRILFKPISRAIEERDGRIDAWEEKTRTLQETVRTKIESYEKELVEVRAKAQEEQQQLSNELKEREKEKVGAVFEEAAQMVASTKQALQEETKRLGQELRRQAEEMAQMVAEKVLGRKVS
ncbi:MAG: ATP synthase F0 subunit B [Deltaproteobacteria bacterium]|nr:ATP synthase F0 subunit B [Deltaproteobacteria bacterium]